ncbi:hypothetical protein JYK22_32295, partial [Nonomuraea sp. RK-328]|nr:hypothetical protein [Nonomuraea sp. RK-328]
LVAELLALAKRFPHLVQLNVTQQADAAVALDNLDVFMKWARQVTAIRAVGVPAQRQAPRQAQRRARRGYPAGKKAGGAADDLRKGRHAPVNPGRAAAPCVELGSLSSSAFIAVGGRGREGR